MSVTLAAFIWVVVHLPALADAAQQLTQVLMTGWILRRRYRLRRLGLEPALADDDLLPPISVVAPAYNEEVGIVNSLSSMLTLDYPDYEVVVVEDGSRDRTFEVLREHFDLQPAHINLDTGLQHMPVTSAWRSPREPRLLVVRKENGGCKSDANNAGICAARNPLLCMVDCDSLLERDALRLVAAPFCRQGERVAAVGGQIRVINGCSVHAGHIEKVALPARPLALLQICEYRRAFMAFRIMWSRFGALPLVSGAFGVFRRDVMMEIGGFNTKSMGEDLDLVMRLHRHAPELKRRGRPYQVVLVPEAYCWTEVPVRFRDITTQRIRWQRGMLETLMAQRAMLFNPRYGLMGMVVVPMFWMIDVLGPFSTAFGLLLVPWLVYHGHLASWHLSLFLITSLGIGVVTSLFAISIESRTTSANRHPLNTILLMSASIIDNYGFRQFNSWLRLRGMWNHLWRKDSTWNSISRMDAKMAPGRAQGASLANFAESASARPGRDGQAPGDGTRP